MKSNLSQIVEVAFPVQHAYVERILSRQKIDHAYCIAAERESGQRAVARYIANRLIGIASAGVATPDLHVAAPEGSKRIGVQQAHAVKMHLSSKPQVGAYRVALIHDAQRLSNQAANALLKTVEEPAEKSVIVMTTDSYDSIPETLRSRMQLLRLPVLSHEQSTQVVKLLNVESPTRAEDAIHYASGHLDRLVRFARDEEEANWWKHQAQLWTDFLTGSTAERDSLISKEFLKPKDSQARIHNIDKILDVIERLLHDAFLHTQRIESGRMVIAKQHPEVAQRYSATQLVHRLTLVDRIRQMAAHNVNKKTLFDYLIVGL